VSEIWNAMIAAQEILKTFDFQKTQKTSANGIKESDG
jgi:hypothetical protein